MVCIPIWLFCPFVTVAVLSILYNVMQWPMWMRILDKKNATIDRLRYAREKEERRQGD